MFSLRSVSNESRWDRVTKGLSATLIVLLGWTLASDQVAGAPPNIVFIMVDDAGTGDYTSYWQNSPVQTPNIDALAAQGMRFTRAYAAAAVCGPSRSGLMSGQHLGHTPIRNNNNTAHFFDKEVTLAEVLQDAGYATGGYGKWGLGAPGTSGAAERQGFDEFVGYYHQVHAHNHYPDRLYDTGQTLLIPENAGFAEPSTGLVSNSRVHEQDIVMDRMKQFIADKAGAGRPFFAYGTWAPPHVKSTIPQSEADPGGSYAPYANVPGWEEFDKIQAAMITWTDRQVGEIVQQLTDLGIADNTIVFFTSDNGGAQASLDWDRNIETIGGSDVNLSGNKGSIKEGGLRVPFIAKWPGKIAPGTTSDLLTYFPDMMATFADAAGRSDLVPSNTDGVSILPTLIGEGTQEARSGIYFEIPAGKNSNAPIQQAARMGDWKLIRSTSGSVSLYNLATDPSETSNVSGNPANAQRVADMIAFMDAEHIPQRAQFNVDPPNVGTGSATKDGIVSFGIRPGSAVDNRDWLLNEVGDAMSLNGLIRDETNTAVGMYLDDLEPDYEVMMSVERTGGASPELLVEMVGNSGSIYFSANYDTSQQAAGTTEEITLPLILTGTAPSAGTLGGDLNDELTLRITHAGGAGEVFVSDISFFDFEHPLFGDLNFDTVVDELDWILVRDNMFSDLSDLTPEESYVLGDLNADNLNNELDFVLFQGAYNVHNGTGSFTSMLATVPEPATGLLLAVGIFALLIGARRSR